MNQENILRTKLSPVFMAVIATTVVSKTLPLLAQSCTNYMIDPKTGQSICIDKRIQQSSPSTPQNQQNLEWRKIFSSDKGDTYIELTRYHQVAKVRNRKVVNFWVKDLYQTPSREGAVWSETNYTADCKEYRFLLIRSIQYNRNGQVVLDIYPGHGKLVNDPIWKVSITQTPRNQKIFTFACAYEK